jgi:hypothetical protein
MKFMTDEDVLYNMNSKYQDALQSSKEGPGTGRGVGSAGLVANQWIVWRTEAIKRGLVNG